MQWLVDFAYVILIYTAFTFNCAIAAILIKVAIYKAVNAIIETLYKEIERKIFGLKLCILKLKNVVQ